MDYNNINKKELVCYTCKQLIKDGTADSVGLNDYTNFFSEEDVLWFCNNFCAGKCFLSNWFLISERFKELNYLNKIIESDEKISSEVMSLITKDKLGCNEKVISNE